MSDQFHFRFYVIPELNSSNVVNNNIVLLQSIVLLMYFNNIGNIILQIYGMNP
jgi:hypothetical protein